MSLYNRLFDENPDSDKLLEIIGMKRESFGRYRDIYPSIDGKEIIVYTRCGGMNRHDWKDLYKVLETHPCYDRDYDDEWDSTYAYIVFKTPEEKITEVRKLADGKEPETIRKKFDREMEEMVKDGTEANKRAKQIAQEIQDGINNTPNGGVIWM